MISALTGPIVTRARFPSSVIAVIVAGDDVERRVVGRMVETVMSQG